MEGTGFYTAIDDVRLQLVPRETSPGSGTFKVYEYYETTHLQTMLKLDFYKALEAGHIIRKCQNCGRYFLLQKGYHLGHTFGVYGYEKLSADELGLREMLSPDGVTKARKAALEHLRQRYPDSALYRWRRAFRKMRDV